MKDTSLIFLENVKLEKLKKYQLDEESILKFQSKIKKVPNEEKQALGQQLFELISSKKKNSNVTNELISEVTELIVNGADLEYKDEKKGDFSLLVCTRKGFKEIAYLLLRAGANVNQANNYLTTTVMAAARHGHKELLELLLLLGANVNAVCYDGDNAIMSAKRHSQQECFDLLVKHQSYLTHKNIANQTILDLPGSVSFTLNLINNSTKKPIYQTSEEDVLSLLKEAKNELLKLKKTFNNQEENKDIDSKPNNDQFIEEPRFR